MVGKPRSGTSLVRAILNNSPDMAIVAETHAFDPPSVLSALVSLAFNRPAECLPDNVPPHYRSERISQILGCSNRNPKRSQRRLGLQLIEGLNGANPQYWQECKRCASYKVLVDAYLHSERNCRDFLDFIMTSFACGKPIVGEKTPAHIHYVPTLLCWYPNSKVVHVVRDVRGVYESQKQKWQTANVKHPGSLHRLIHTHQMTNAIYSIFCTLVTWLRVTQLDRQFSQLYTDRYHLVRYEDLLACPEREVREICNFIGVEFAYCMLDHDFDNTSFPADHDLDDNRFAVKFYPNRADRWRSRINPWSNRIIRLVAGRELRRLRYLDAS